MAKQQTEVEKLRAEVEALRQEVRASAPRIAAAARKASVEALAGALKKTLREDSLKSLIVALGGKA